MKFHSGETIKIGGHSQGAAYAAGIATALADPKYGTRGICGPSFSSSTG